MDRWIKRLLICIALTTLCMVAFACATAESSGTWGNLTWTLNDEGLLTIQGSGDMGRFDSTDAWKLEKASINTVIIEPGVTSIGDSAFRECSSMTSVIIPEGVTSIGEYAFCYCRNLTSVTIPMGVISIGEYAFYNCTSLTSVTIPNGVTSIGGLAFDNCTSLTSVTIPESITNIEIGTFSGCSSLTSVIIPESVSIIGANAFTDCSNLTSVTIPEGITNIEGGSFSGCRALKSVTIPKGVTTIEDLTFFECSNLTSITIPEGVATIGYSAFGDCRGLTNITIPESVTSIGNTAFASCSSLTSVTIPEGVTSIGAAVFSGCNNLTSVTIPESVTCIRYNTFYGCSKLTSVTIPEGVTVIESSTFWECSSLASVSIPESVTTIEDGAFGNCPYLSLYIPESVKSFGNSIMGWKTYFGMIYCHEYSDADYWATENGYNVVYVDDLPGDVWNISLPEDFRLACGVERQLMAGVLSKVANPAITWSSSVPEVASVLSDGVVKALKPGTAVITAHAGEISAGVTVTTYAVAEDFAMPGEALVVAKGTLQLAPEGIVPAGAELELTWSSDDEDVARVDSNGLVTGRKPGDAVITATDSSTGIARSVQVHVCYPVSAIELTPTQVISVNKSFQLTANVTMRDESTVNQLVTFETDNVNIATVDENGLVTGRNPGMAVITVTAESGVSASCEITVVDRVVFNLPADLKRIESGAFANLPLPDAVRIPEGVTEIADDAFQGTDVVLYVVQDSTAQAWAEAHGYRTIVE